MNKASLLSIAVVTLASGCAGDMGSSPAFTAQTRCEGNGGTWHTNLGICEVRSGR